MGFLFPTKAASRRASELDHAVREAEVNSQTYADDETAYRATIHTRQDVVLLVSMQADIHRQLVKISRGVWFWGFVIAALVAGIADHYS
jgi:cell division protein FtsX